MHKKPVFRLIESRFREVFFFVSVVFIFFFLWGFIDVSAETCRVWEKIEIVLHAEESYENPYTEVEVWVDLEGPGFNRRCYGFWDGEYTYRVRVMATVPGMWTWISGSNQSDTGLNSKKGYFTASAWSEAEKDKNPCLHGMIKQSANGHAFEYADGTPFFLLGDTWWATPTFRFKWYDDDKERPLGPEAGFKDYVKFREKQGYNCIAMIAAFPNWVNDDKPPLLKTDEGIILRDAWHQAGSESAKDMHDENGNRVFLFPGRIPGHENYFPDVDRINPEYFHNFDKKIDYLNAHGFIPFIEISRRDIGPGWKEYYEWPESYTRYIQYIWSRYQANNCLYSPIHFDWENNTIPADDWNIASNLVIEKYGHPPFGTLASCNAAGSSLHWFDHRDNATEREKNKQIASNKVNYKAKDKAKWITFHQFGNRRTHNYYNLLTELFDVNPPLPAINGEPYYAGMEDAPGGTKTSALYCRSAMYGSLLSGGLGGHIYGAGGWEGGLWGGDIEDDADVHIWDSMIWASAAQMKHLRTFVLSEGNKYQDLVPDVNLVSPNKSGDTDSCIGWAYCAHTPNKDFFLLYFEKNSPQAMLSGAQPNGKYEGSWFNPRTGAWIETDIENFIADQTGQIAIPEFPDNSMKSIEDWGLKLMLRDIK